MNEERKDVFFDLLIAKAVSGLDDEAERQLDEFDAEEANAEFRSLEQTAATISLIDIDPSVQMPPHLFARIADDAREYVVAADPENVGRAIAEPEKSGPTPWFAWLGWAVAAAACVALAANIFFTPSQKPEVALDPASVELPRVLTPAERREEMLRSNVAMVKAEWALGNVKDIRSIAGDVIWSDEMQSGYMRFRGLPANNPHKETYQLWIFDKTQNKATPIDGGTFDVPYEGEIVIPIDAKLKPQGPEMFAVTIEKPGGVVVSSRERIAALAKVTPGIS